ncbi:hypothetical protein DL93DRAFT_2080736, partial [Clavulina sp. PMI_390]
MASTTAFARRVWSKTQQNASPLLSSVITTPARRSSSALSKFTSAAHSQIRAKSTASSSSTIQNPYGKSHRQRVPALPRPTVALFPQTVVMTDGSTFTHWTTSPRSVFRLTRDVNNNPLYRPGNEGDDQLEDEAGRLGRFRRRFEGVSGAGEGMDYSAFDTTGLSGAGAMESNKPAAKGGEKK